MIIKTLIDISTMLSFVLYSFVTFVPLLPTITLNLLFIFYIHDTYIDVYFFILGTFMIFIDYCSMILLMDMTIRTKSVSACLLEPMRLPLYSQLKEVPKSVKYGVLFLTSCTIMEMY